MAQPAEPAFHVPRKQALSLINDGLAVPVDECTRIQLTFSRIANLRDSSCKIDERFLMAYVEGKRWAKITASIWHSICGDWLEWTPEQMVKSQERIQSFV